MTDEELHDELITLLLAGHETASCCCLLCIDSSPSAVHQTLLAELNSLGQTPQPTAIVHYPISQLFATLRICPVAVVTVPEK